MHSAFVKTFGGLSRPYYFRQMFFGLMLTLFTLGMMWGELGWVPFNMIFVGVLNMLLYPYARFVYESVMDFIIGENVFIMNMFFAVFMKIMIMGLCWGLSVFIAPIGLVYLYYYHSKV